MKQFFLEHKLLFSLSGILSGVGLILLSLFFFPWEVVSSLTQASPAELSSNQEFTQESNFGVQEKANLMTVEIAGAVLHPGVYQLAREARAVSLIQQAGGFSQDADKNWIAHDFNQAQVLQDGDKIYINFQGETKSTQVAASPKATTKKKTTKVTSQK